MQNALFYCFFPFIAALIGGGIALVKSPSPYVKSCIQHFAAGVVFSVVAVELLPDIIKKHAPFFVVLGFALGISAMLIIKSLTRKAEENAQSASLAMLTAVAVDVILDGFLVGIGFAAGAEEGLLLTIALTIEMLSLGLAVIVELGSAGLSRSKSMLYLLAISGLLFVGTGIGTMILSHVSDNVLETVLSFGLVALLFLVTEELLVEAHEQPETPFTTALFFVGFLLFVILSMTNLK